jgi:hypothetical protein
MVFSNEPKRLDIPAPAKGQPIEPLTTKDGITVSIPAPVKGATDPLAVASPIKYEFQFLPP